MQALSIEIVPSEEQMVNERATNIGKIVLALARHEVGDWGDCSINDPVVSIIDDQQPADMLVAALDEMDEKTARGIVEQLEGPTYPLIAHLLAECHNSFKETGNAVFVWRAIDYCSPTYWGHRTEIPQWCCDYLFEAARKIMAPIYQTDARGSDWKRMLKRIPAALGLSSQGKNQLKTTASALRKIQTAKDYHSSRAAMRLTAEQALDAVAGRAPVGDTPVDNRDPDEDRIIFATVAEGVRLSTGGKAPPRRRSGNAKVTKPAG